mmetsp:Transcript_83807/g.201056  ORF Transcript_83807/g.201056 Transcript_83807/m.201056 type:complete len:390 (+) Transcript_83807:756-1925(+)
MALGNLHLEGSAPASGWRRSAVHQLQAQGLAHTHAELQQRHVCGEGMVLDIGAQVSLNQLHACAPHLRHDPWELRMQRGQLAEALQHLRNLVLGSFAGLLGAALRLHPVGGPNVPHQRQRRRLQELQGEPHVCYRFWTRLCSPPLSLAASFISAPRRGRRRRHGLFLDVPRLCELLPPLLHPRRALVQQGQHPPQHAHGPEGRVDAPIRQDQKAAGHRPQLLQALPDLLVLQNAGAGAVHLPRDVKECGLRPFKASCQGQKAVGAVLHGVHGRDVLNGLPQRLAQGLLIHQHLLLSAVHRILYQHLADVRQEKELLLLRTAQVHEPWQLRDDVGAGLVHSQRRFLLLAGPRRADLIIRSPYCSLDDVEQCKALLGTDGFRAYTLGALSH